MVRPDEPRITITLAVPRVVWAALVAALLTGSCAALLVVDAVVAHTATGSAGSAVARQ